MHEHHCCEHTTAQPSVHQSLDELEFERGIWSAALDGDNPRLQSLLRRGHCSVDDTDSAGYTALHYAARSGHLESCFILLKRGASVDCRTRAGQATPLHRAAANGKVEICKLLAEHGADLKATDADGKTALDRAEAGKQSNVVTLLLSLGARKE